MSGVRTIALIFVRWRLIEAIKWSGKHYTTNCSIVPPAVIYCLIMCQIMYQLQIMSQVILLWLQLRT